MSERASRCPEGKGSRHTALPPGGPGSGECWTRDRGQLGSGMIIHFSIEEKPFLPRGEGEAASDSPASDERNSQWRSGLLSGLNPLQTMLLLTHSLLLFQGGGDSSWLIYEVLQLRSSEDLGEVILSESYPSKPLTQIATVYS